jgi:transcriptional regulator with XRE-family HTH domain
MLGKDQTQVAALGHLSVRQLANLERGFVVRCPSDDRLAGLANALATTPEALRQAAGLA